MAQRKISATINMFTSGDRSPRERWSISTPSALGLCFCLTTFATCFDLCAAEITQETQAVRHTIERSVPFIERQGAEWIATKDCLSCHHTSFMVWSLNAAKRNGIHVDEKKLDELTEWASDWRHLVVFASRAKSLREDTLRGQSDTVAQLLLGRSALGSSAIRVRWAQDYVLDLAKIQQPDGSWTSGGQLPAQKRPKRETQEVSTMWALLALLAQDIRDDSCSAALKKARAWLGNETSGQSTEWWATRLMLERKSGSADKADQLRQELLKRQRADGGWGWLCDDDSDALGTGIAIFALASDHLPASHPAIAKATKFLLVNQSNDGSWPVRGTKQNKKDRVEPTATFWGTCWAVIGLCETLDPSRR
jgi:hypothetical protein